MLEIELTNDNYFEFGINQSPFKRREKPTDEWYVKYHSKNASNTDWFESNLQAAKLISDKYERPLLAFSGGIDSEVMVRFFLESKKKFDVAIIRFEEDLNQHDIKYAEDFCRKNSIRPIYFDINVKELWNSDFPLNQNCISPQFSVLMFFMQRAHQQGYTPVLGSGEPFIKREEGKNTFFLHEKEKVASLYYFLIEQQFEGIAGFFQYTYDQTKSFINDPYIRDFTTNAKERKILSSTKIKYEFYQKYFPELKQREKYTGYENLKDEDRKLRNILEEKFVNQTAMTPISDFINL